MVEWCAVGGGVISAVYTSLGLEMLQCQHRFCNISPDGTQESVDRCKRDEVERKCLRRHLEENCGIFAFSISRATTLINISQMGQSRTLGWCLDLWNVERGKGVCLKKTSASPRTRARVEMHCDSNLARSGYGRFSSLRQNQTWTT